MFSYSRTRVKKRLKPIKSYTFWQSVRWPWEYDSKSTEINSSLSPIVTFVLMLFSYSSNTSESRNTNKTNFAIFIQKSSACILLHFQATYHHVHQTWGWRILSAAEYLILKKQLTVPKSLAEVHGDCQPFKQNWDKIKPRHFKYHYYKCALLLIGLEFHWLHLNYSPDYAVNLGMRRLPKVNP